MYVSSSHKVRVVLHEECQHKHADVHSVVIGIGCDDDLVVSEILHIIFHAKGIHQECELLVFRNLLAALLVAVDRLTSEAEYGLGLCIAGLCDGSARRVSLGDEYTCELRQLFLCCRKLVIVVDLAVAELTVVDVGSLVSLLSLLLDCRDLLALLLGLSDLLLQDRDDLLVHVQIVVQICLQELVDGASDSRTLLISMGSVLVLHVSLPHVCRTELCLGLSLEVRLLDLDADSSDDTLTDVLRVEILLSESLVELLQGLRDTFPHRSEVGTTVARVLSVYE